MDLARQGINLHHMIVVRNCNAVKCDFGFIMHGKFGNA